MVEIETDASDTKVALVYTDTTGNERTVEAEFPEAYRKTSSQVRESLALILIITWIRNQGLQDTHIVWKTDNTALL
jgi:hypothetical protein